MPYPPALVRLLLSETRQLTGIAPQHDLHVGPGRITVLDVGLSYMDAYIDGFDVCRRIYRAHPMLLTAQVDEIDSAVRLEIGSDDSNITPKPRPQLDKFLLFTGLHLTALNDRHGLVH